MKVHELMSLLSELNPELLVVLSKDEEGNGFKELNDVATDRVFVQDGYRGAVYYDSSALEQDVDPEDVYDGDDGKPCVVLWS